MTLLPVSIETGRQDNSSTCSEPRFLTQQEFARLLELADCAVRWESLDAQARKQVEYMKDTATWD